MALLEKNLVVRLNELDINTEAYTRENSAQNLPDLLKKDLMMGQTPITTMRREMTTADSIWTEYTKLPEQRVTNQGLTSGE